MFKDLALKLFYKRPCNSGRPHTAFPGRDMAWFLCLCVFVAASLTLLALQLKSRTPARGPREPPRLPALPLIGSLLSLRSPYPPHVFFKELQVKYGHTYSLMMGSHNVIVINQHVHAREVLLKKGKSFAGRPRTVGILLPKPFLFSSFLSHSCLVCDEGDHRCSD